MLALLFPAAAALGQEVGSKACSGCHAEIYRSYSATGMSRTSGKAGVGEFRENFEPPNFKDDRLGVEYRVSQVPGGYRLQFSRVDSGAQGQRLLGWFIGSGRVGRSYFSSLDGFLFQSPVSYYTLASKWDVSPGYQRYPSINLTRAVETGCLQCHASRLQPVAGTQNRFADPPFLEGGVGCERCHGPGRNHVLKMSSGNRKGSSQIVNPSKLDPARRDSVCAQCHLAGAARIARLRAKREPYRPGELLSDYSAFFVWAGSESSTLSVNSHVERLQQSLCKRASGDRLWCGSCHDPHSESEKASGFYRARCQKCHQTSACKETAAARRKLQDDCVACHMPKSPVRDAEHAVYTDHSIPRRPRASEGSAAVERSLTEFWRRPATGEDDRDRGLAYASVAGTDSSLRRRAIELLSRAEARYPEDVPVLTQMAQLYDQAGSEDRAIELCERILRLDPAQVSVAINLGTYYIQRGRTSEAMQLWTDALSRNPGLTGTRINLAVAQFKGGDPASAEATLVKALEYDPDHQTARKMLSGIRAGAP
jgi:tetratricopeptide (TPR) repeat protein